jgi:hypothetical protein
MGDVEAHPASPTRDAKRAAPRCNFLRFIGRSLGYFLGTKFIPHSGQRPGPGEVTWACIGHT